MNTTNPLILEPKTQAFVDALAVRGGEPIYKLSYADARSALAVLATGTTLGFRHIPTSWKGNFWGG